MLSNLPKVQNGVVQTSKFERLKGVTQFGQKKNRGKVLPKLSKWKRLKGVTKFDQKRYCIKNIL